MDRQWKVGRRIIIWAHVQRKKNILFINLPALKGRTIVLRIYFEIHLGIWLDFVDNHKNFFDGLILSDILDCLNSSDNFTGIAVGDTQWHWRRTQRAQQRLSWTKWRRRWRTPACLPWPSSSPMTTTGDLPWPIFSPRTMIGDQVSPCISQLTSSILMSLPSRGWWRGWSLVNWK